MIAGLLSVLALLDHITTDEFGRGGERVEREGLRQALLSTTRARLLPVGSTVWFWLQDQNPAADAWVPATIAGHGGKDGYHVYDIALGAGWAAWGWLWQVRPRAAGEAAPEDRPGSRARSWSTRGRGGSGGVGAGRNGGGCCCTSTTRTERTGIFAARSGQDST